MLWCSLGIGSLEQTEASFFAEQHVQRMMSVKDAGPVDKALNALYSVMQSIEVRELPRFVLFLEFHSDGHCCLIVTVSCLQGRLGGGEGVCGIYGSITQTGMKRVFDCLRHSTGLDGASTLVDIGAGLGRQVWALPC